MTDGVRRLSHEDAEMLISARMDEQLDRADSRALLVHLQSCESCRAFAVQSEVLGRELAALPVLPPSAVVDRQVRESIAKGRSRWTLGSLMPAAGSGGGLRVAIGALAMLTIVSVFLLVRMADDQTGESPAIDAPNGGVAQQINQTPPGDDAPLDEAAPPTATARVVVPKAPESDSTEVGAPTKGAEGSTSVAAASTEAPDVVESEPTATLDSGFVYTIGATKTPQSDGSQPTETSEPGEADSTATTEDVSVAMAVTDDGTVAADPTGDESPVATATADEHGEATEQPSAPAEEPSGEATIASETATEEPEEAISPTTTPEPTVTPTPVEISVEETEAPPEPTAQAPSADATEAIQVESPESGESPEAEPTQTASPPDQTPTPSQPYGQPTIAPISGQTGGQQETGETQIGADDNSPQIVPNDGNEIENGSSGSSEANGASVAAAETPETGDGPQSDESSSSPPIVPSDGTSVPGGVGGNNGQSGQSQELQSPTPVPTVDDSIQPSGLDLSTMVTSLPSGTTSPAGRLEFSPGMNLFVVVAPDGQLAVADLNGELVVTLGQSELPVWSGSGLMFSTQGSSGLEVGIWNSETGELSAIPPSDKASDDLPIGGNGSAFYYLRSYPDSGIVELRSATIDGSDNGVLWTSDEVTLGAPRPLYSESGVYLPTDSEWLFIDWSGAQSSLGQNPYGFIGTPVLSPGGGLMAYSAGDQVIVAWTDRPGEATATAPFTPPGSYAFSTSGEEIVISDGSSLYVVSYEGQDLGQLAGNQPIGGVYWIDDAIYYLQIGEDAALKSTSLGAIQSG